MISQNAANNIERTPQKSAAFPSPLKPTISQATHASSSTPIKAHVNTPEQVTPQSHRYPDVQITPSKEQQLPTKQGAEPVNALLTETATTLSPETPHGNDDTILAKAASNPSKPKDSATKSETKTQKTITGKRSRSSPNKKIAWKLLLDVDTGNEDDACADGHAKPSSNTDA